MGRLVKKSPRVYVTLSPEANDLVFQVAKITGQSKSSIVAELMDVALPALQQLGEALKVVKDAPLEAQRMMTRFANAATGELDQAMLDLDAAIDPRTVKGKRVRRAQRVAQS